MIRLTLILLAGIAVTLSVAGREPDMAAGTGVDVARAETDLTGPGAQRLALDDEAGAIARALSASEMRAARSQEEAARDGLAEAPAGSALAAEGGRGADVARVNADRVNLRAGPSTANQVLDQVVRDQEVRVLETREDGWSRIAVPDSGVEAWIFGRFLSPIG